MTRTRSIHYCNVCDYKTDRKYDRDKHVTRMHGSNVQQNASQAHEIGFNITQESIQHTYPNEDYNVNNIQNQHNSQYGSGSTHIPIEKHNEAIEDYREVVGIAHKWKKECEKMQEAYQLLEEHRREDGENSHAIITYLQNVLNANNIRFNLDLA